MKIITNIKYLPLLLLVSSPNLVHAFGNDTIHSVPIEFGVAYLYNNYSNNQDRGDNQFHDGGNTNGVTISNGYLIDNQWIFLLNLGHSRSAIDAVSSLDSYNALDSGASCGVTRTNTNLDSNTAAITLMHRFSQVYVGFAYAYAYNKFNFNQCLDSGGLVVPCGNAITRSTSSSITGIASYSKTLIECVNINMSAYFSYLKSDKDAYTLNNSEVPASTFKTTSLGSNIQFAWQMTRHMESYLGAAFTGVFDYKATNDPTAGLERLVAGLVPQFGLNDISLTLSIGSKIFRSLNASFAYTSRGSGYTGYSANLGFSMPINGMLKTCKGEGCDAALRGWYRSPSSR